MKREILFRGKRVDTGEWVEGSLIGNDVIVGKIVEFDEDYFCTEFWYKVDPETVGQFTGITDKNGTKIFEGDIIVRNIFGWIRKYKCKWSTCYERFQFVGIDTVVSIYVEDITDILKTYKTGIEIVGNIHDNPELL